jgi:hypothetical protein
VSRRALSRVFLTSLVAGLVLMLAFDRPATRLLGVMSLAVCFVAGLFLVADKEFLAGDR